MPDAPDDVPPLEKDLPARASAMLGASANVSAKNSVTKRGQTRFSAGEAMEGRVDMAMSVREPTNISAR
jgi:hypothetical protein